MESLPRGRTAAAQTFPYVAAPRAAGHALGAGDHPVPEAAPWHPSLSLWTRPRGKAPAPSLSPGECPTFPRRKWPLLPNQNFSPQPPNFSCVCGKAPQGSELQAETSGLGAEGEEEEWAARLSCLGHHPGPSRAPLHNAAPWLAWGAIFGHGDNRVTHGRDNPHGEWMSCITAALSVPGQLQAPALRGRRTGKQGCQACLPTKAGLRGPCTAGRWGQQRPGRGPGFPEPD